MDFYDGSKITLTGATGFLGSHLLKSSKFKKALVIGRSKPKGYSNFKSVSFNDNKKLSSILAKTDILVHVAARVHIMREKSKNSLNEFIAVNKNATLNLARQAAHVGVKRFIFISTIKVLGEKTKLGNFFTNTDPFCPQDSYSISKMEAEIGLKKIAEESGMELVIIRPPLIYGSGAKGNFLYMKKVIKTMIPLPFAAIRNKRSLVSVENLVNLIERCLDHPNAKNQTFLVSDDRDVSTPELLSMLARAGNHNILLFSVPKRLLVAFFCLLGQTKLTDRLCGSMQVNIEYTKRQLDWEPPVKVHDGLMKCWF